MSGLAKITGSFRAFPSHQRLRLDRAEIQIVARLVGERVQITVSDTGPGLNDAGVRPSYSTGVGLANIRDRLAQAYGPDHRFDARNQPGGGFVVTIDMPFQPVALIQEAA